MTTKLTTSHATFPIFAFKQAFLSPTTFTRFPPLHTEILGSLYLALTDKDHKNGHLGWIQEMDCRPW